MSWSARRVKQLCDELSIPAEIQKEFPIGTQVIATFSKYRLSIQTAQEWIFGAFAETALLLDDDIHYDYVLGYEDVCRWDSPESLQQHLISMKDKL